MLLTGPDLLGAPAGFPGCCWLLACGLEPAQVRGCRIYVLISCVLAVVGVLSSLLLICRAAAAVMPSITAAGKQLGSNITLQLWEAERGQTQGVLLHSEG